MDPRPPEADAAHMTVLELRNVSQDGMRRFGRGSMGVNVQELRESIKSGSYEVDPRAVAAAILARLRSDARDQCS